MKPSSPLSDRDSAGHGAVDEAGLPALGWMRRAHAENELLVEVAKQIRSRRRARIAVVTGALVVGILSGALVWRQTNETNQLPLQTATVSFPERRVLPDDTIVELRNGAHIDVDYSGEFRRVVLRQGEALFQVAKNKARPFIVEAAGIKVRAVGTAFSVQLDDQKQVEVLVTEGRVQVAPFPVADLVATDPGPKPALSSTDPAGFTVAQPIMDAGQRATISLGKASFQIVAVSDGEIADLLSWRVPNLEFSRTPLDEIVALMNRHAAGKPRVQFVIADPELSQIRLTGLLRTDNCEGLVRLLENNFSVETERSGGKITLRRRR